jgi:hypothetical protein
MRASRRAAMWIDGASRRMILLRRPVSLMGKWMELSKAAELLDAPITTLSDMVDNGTIKSRGSMHGHVRLEVCIEQKHLDATYPKDPTLAPHLFEQQVARNHTLEVLRPLVEKPIEYAEFEGGKWKRRGLLKDLAVSKNDEYIKKAYLERARRECGHAPSGIAQEEWELFAAVMLGQSVQGVGEVLGMTAGEASRICRSVASRLPGGGTVKERYERALRSRYVAAQENVGIIDVSHDTMTGVIDHFEPNDGPTWRADLAPGAPPDVIDAPLNIRKAST